MSDRVGQHFGNYRLVALLGQGGYAEVYLGQHVRLELQAAIKVLHTHLTDQEAQHFQQEAETIARLAHPSIVRILDYDVQEDVLFLVMEYAPGGSLRRRYPKGRVLPLPQIVSYVQQVAAALQSAHEQQLIHRDVKPENMLLGRRQEVLLSDFGLATLAQSSSQLDRSAQGTAGTIAYMAPEQIEGHPRAASDQYALAVVVYEWLCGSRPFEGSMSEIMVQHLTMPPPPLREKLPTVSPEPEQVVLRALAKDPKARFVCVHDFALALQAACGPESSGAPLLGPSFAPPIEAGRVTKHNLPMPPTPFVGREREVTTIDELLRRPEVYLVTLTGPGGIGKTRLALQVAAALSDQFPDGTFFVGLALVSDPEQVVPTILQTLSISEAANQPLLVRLKSVLKDKQMLLLLDNFEQVVGAAVVVAELLVACPKLKIMITSRVVLHVQAEHEYAVPPLSLPNLKRLPDLVTLAQNVAVALFMQRAQAVKPDFAVTNANAPAVAGICARLDGLPLAIELAAARVKYFPPPALLARLQQGLSLLTGGARDVPARQQTLHATLAWSYNLLAPEEQQLFRRLAVFVDGCTVEAAEAVCRAAGELAGDVLDGLLSLVDKSLLRQQESVEGEARFGMLQLLRDFGLEVLESAGETEVTRQAHAEYYLRLAEEATPRLRGNEQGSWLARLEQEHQNLRAALTFLLEQAQRQAGTAQGRAPAEHALRLCAALDEFWELRGYLLEGQAFLEQALALRSGVRAAVQAQGLSNAADMALIDDLERAETLCSEALALYRELGDRVGLANCLSLLGSAARIRGQYRLAAARLEEAAALFGEQGNSPERTRTLREWAKVAIEQGRYPQAQALLEESLALSQALGNQALVAWTRLLLGRLLFLTQREPAQAERLVEQGLEQAEAQGIGWMRAFALGLLGHMHLARGEWIQARTKLEESAVFQQEIGLRGDSCEPLLGLARMALGQQQLGEARRRAQESLRIEVAIGSQALVPACLEVVGLLLAAQGRAPEAAVRWGTAQALREELGAPMHPVERADYEQAVATARRELGEEAFAAGWAKGRTTPLEQVIAETLRMNGEAGTK